MNSWPLEWREDTRRFESRSAGISQATLVLYFGSRETLADRGVYESLRAACPEAQILGCSTGTVIQDKGIDDDRAAAVAIRLERSSVRMVSMALEGKTDDQVGRDLAADLAAPDLAGVLVFSEGLHVNGSALVAGFQAVLGPEIPIAGGLAADGAAFETTLVAANAPGRVDLVAAVGFYGRDLQIGMGAAHGWDLFGPQRRISRACGAVLQEMDGKPALELYKRYLGEEADQLPSSALLYPLLVSNPADPSDQVIRTVLAVDHDASTMTFAGDIPEGWNAKLMRGVSESLTEGAARAARAAVPPGDNGSEGLALLVSCVGRRLAMGQGTADEVEAVDEALPAGLRRIGFYSYGEIATKGIAGHCGLHNQTMTIMTIREAVSD